MRTTVILVLLLGASLVPAQDWADLGSDELERYFERRVTQLEDPLGTIETVGDWERERPRRRAQLLEMLGLDPMPERTDLKATVTGVLERDRFTVEKLHFQSSPGLYVTANLYLPKERAGKVPAVLYVCGHGPSKKDGVSFGNKVSYQHHGVWFARNGYACLVIDTLQLGEIEEIHHGTYRYDRWWWHARGYTSAGVEAWNCVRALDYLESREEIDGERLGVTGRSGGGAYSWWIAAIDERVKVAVPVAGIASLRNHVVDGCVEGHCDCMYQLNTYRWDFEEVAALVAPRALLLSNTDKDRIFPLDGVQQVYWPVRRLYALHDADGALGLNIEEGPHKDTQPLRTAAFHWFNRHLQGAELGHTYRSVAEKLFEPHELKVFGELPADEINTKIDEVFVPVAKAPVVPSTEADWRGQAERWRTGLLEKCFRGWPALESRTRLIADGESAGEGYRLVHYDLESEPDVTCRLILVLPGKAKLKELDELRVRVASDEKAVKLLGEGVTESAAGSGLAVFHPRGLGFRKWSPDERKQVQIRRRFALIGQTLDGMRTWDIRQAVRALRAEGFKGRLILEAEGVMAGNALYASLFLKQPVTELNLRSLPVSHHDGPIYLNVLRVLDLPAAVALAVERSKVTLHSPAPGDWGFARETARVHGFQLEVEEARD